MMDGRACSAPESISRANPILPNLQDQTGQDERMDRGRPRSCSTGRRAWSRTGQGQGKPDKNKSVPSPGLDKGGRQGATDMEKLAAILDQLQK